MYLIRYIFCTAHLFKCLQFFSGVCIDHSVMIQHLSTYEVIYFVLVMQVGDISIKLFKVILEGQQMTDFNFANSDPPHPTHTVTHTNI